MDRIHEVHFIGRKPSERTYVFRSAAYKKVKQLPDLTFCGQKSGLTCQKQLTKKEARMGF